MLVLTHSLSHTFSYMCLRPVISIIDSSQAVKELIESLPNTLMYIVARPGPTSFLIKEDGSEVKYKASPLRI